MQAVLDTSVLIALLDSEHMHHETVTQWLTENGQRGWATCPLTQNGCIRIMSQRAYVNSTPAAVVAEILTDAVSDPKHEFWPDSLSLLAPGVLQWDKLLSGRRLTDVYLLALAVSHKARLVTLDQGIPFGAVPKAKPGNLLVLANPTH